jgi:hypothetical protein
LTLPHKIRDSACVRTTWEPIGGRAAGEDCRAVAGLSVRLKSRGSDR